MSARQARPARGRQLANRFILAFLVVLALAGLYGVAGLSHAIVLTAATPPAPPGRLEVSSALVACPGPGSAGVTGGDLAEASVPASTGSGQVIVTELNAAAKTQPPAPVGTAPQPGQLTVKTIAKVPVVPAKVATMPAMAGGAVPTSVARGGLILSATGSDAQGLDVEQLGPDGQPTARCQSPGSDFWFVGPEGIKQHTELYLMNADSTPADAHVSVQTDSGPLLGAKDLGIVVPPHAMIIQSLDKLVHSAKAAAFHVTTSTGRVVAAMRVSSSATKPGIWLPAAQQPATTQVLTGLPATTGTRELYITVPGGAAARVKVTAVTPRGSYQPTGGNGISLLGHLTTGVSIPSLSGFPGSIMISADVPVTAVLEISGGPPGAPGAFIGGSDAVTEQGVVAASPAGTGGITAARAVRAREGGQGQDRGRGSRLAADRAAWPARDHRGQVGHQGAAEPAQARREGHADGDRRHAAARIGTRLRRPAGRGRRLRADRSARRLIADQDRPAGRASVPGHRARVLTCPCRA